MVELFTFAQYAQVFSQELTKKDDSITCAAISSKYISLGTSKGFVHLLDIQLKEAELIGPYTRIYHLTTIGSIVVFCTENKVIAYDSEQANEILNVDVNFPIKVGIANNNLGQLAVVCATNTELVLMQKGWVRVSKRTIKASLVSVNDLKVHAHLVCLATKGKFEFFNLIQEKTIYNLEIPETSKGLIHWASASMCFVSSAATIFVLDYAQNQGTDTFMLIKTLNITAQPCSIGSFNQGYLLSLDESAFSVYSMQQELTFAAKSPVSRFLLSYNQSNAPFYIVGDKEIYKISPLTAKDKLKHLIDKKKFTGAYDLAKKFKLDRTIIDEAQIVNLIETDMMYEASQLAFNISHQSTVWNIIIQEFMKKDLLYLIVMIMPIPNDDLIQENILIQLLEHKDPIILDYIIPKLPPDIVSKVIFVNTSIDKVLQGTIINYFLSANKTIEALDIALKVKSIQTFKILSEYSDTFQLFLQNPSYFSDLFDIDVNKANEVCKRYRELIDYEKLLENVNGAKIMSFINDLLVENPNPKLENAMFDLLLTHQPDSLSIFIESCKNLDLNQALSKCAAKKALDGQIVILKKLKRNEEIIEILMNNFSLRLKYIHHYPELWRQTFTEAKEDIQKTKSVLEVLKYHPNPVEFIREIDIETCDEEIKDLLMSLGSYIKAYIAASKAAKIEIPQIFKKLYHELLKPFKIQAPFLCQECAKPLEVFIARKCGHHTHKECSTVCRFCKNIFNSLVD